MVRFPDEEELRIWVKELELSGLRDALPDIDDEWYRQMLSSYQLTAMRPDCLGNLCLSGAVVFHRITKNHYRVDGNKRSAVISTFLLFNVNGSHLNVSWKDLYAISKEVARSKKTPEVVVGAIHAVFSVACRKR